MVLKLIGSIGEIGAWKTENALSFVYNSFEG